MHCPSNIRCQAWSNLLSIEQDACFIRCLVRLAGQTAFLPGGWLTAHVSLSEGVAVTGRWLQRGAVAPQIASWQHAVSVHSACRAPQRLESWWHAHGGLQRCAGMSKLHTWQPPSTLSTAHCFGVWHIAAANSFTSTHNVALQAVHISS